MLDVKQATQIAIDYFNGLYGAASSRVQLEEVELTEDGSHWLITLSYQPASEIAVLLKPNTPREYKVFKITANTGQVQSMKIRKVG